MKCYIVCHENGKYPVSIGINKKRGYINIEITMDNYKKLKRHPEYEGQLGGCKMLQKYKLRFLQFHFTEKYYQSYHNIY